MYVTAATTPFFWFCLTDWFFQVTHVILKLNLWELLVQHFEGLDDLTVAQLSMSDHCWF